MNDPNTPFEWLKVDGMDALVELTLDLHWSWNHAADELWQALDQGLWATTQNPWVILRTVSHAKIKAALGAADFRHRLETLLQHNRESYRADAWFQHKYPGAGLSTIAYFSMEFMLSEALPIYSGGLGNVAGDQMKAASDLGVPVVGVGLLYGQGYFRQDFDLNGRQQALYPVNDPGQLPIRPLRQPNGEWLRLQIQLPGSKIWLRCWEVSVGRAKLYLLDTNDFANTAAHRGITSELYGGDAEMRLKQEIVLGIGGWRLLRAIGLQPEVCHLNEGHAAFLDSPKPAMTPLEQFVSRRDQAIPRIAHAQNLQQRDQWEAAEWELERVVEVDPTWSQTLFLQAFVQEHDNKLIEAKALLIRATLLKKAEIAGYELGVYRLNHIQSEMADETRTLLNHPGDEEATRSIAELWLELGRYDLARPLVQQLEQRPGGCEDDVNLARYLLASNNIQNAVALLQQAAACTGPHSLDGMIALATQLESVKQDTEAEHWFVLAYKRDPENAWIDLADFLRRHNRAEGALPYALAAVKKTSDDTDALNEVAKIELQLGRTDDAELWFKRALVTYTDNSDALVGLARIAGKRGQWERAKKLCGDAVKGNSWDNFDGWVCVGDSDRALGHVQEALRAYQNALWLRPSDTPVSSSIAHLYAIVSDAGRASLYASFATPR